MMRLLWTLKPRREGSICLPFLPFFLLLALAAPWAPSTSEAAPTASPSVTGFLGLISMSMKEAPKGSASLGARRSLASFTACGTSIACGAAPPPIPRPPSPLSTTSDEQSARNQCGGGRHCGKNGSGDKLSYSMRRIGIPSEGEVFLVSSPRAGSGASWGSESWDANEPWKWCFSRVLGRRLGVGPK